MIRVTNLQKFFGDQLLFNDVNLTIGEGEKIGLIGRNGSGKSTFLKMLLERDDSKGGEIECHPSVVIRSLEQNLDFGAPTVLAQVCSALPADSVHEEWRAKASLMGLGFEEFDFDRPPFEFSSGFKIRIRLAETLVSDSHLLLLDEPTNYLDIVSLRWLEHF
ncbi:ABC-F family ATP-binding cassette domain-containing protein [Candidatus Peregrinibacteria bacterium]|nr:MAG: ABC-F family ATP-binding cassette domain-containing protein [Candidatus Peregrinibacteria bacterium]